MSIQIDVVRISGFRGISNIEIALPRIALLIGTNNSGKTSVIKALQLALGDYLRYLSDEDFYIDESDHRSEKVLVDVRVVSLDDAGQRQLAFGDDWLQEFGDKVQAEANGAQFLAIRTVVKNDPVKGGFVLERFALESWPSFDNWQDESPGKKRKISKRYDALPFISIDAQRDIHQELKEKASFIGRVLSSVSYDEADVQKLEEMVAEINREAIEKSEPLKELKQHLDSLNQSFDGGGETELTPFPKKIRDLSKRFSVHFGESDNSSFSMEYHGMGTRSWASMLTVKAFTNLMAKNHQEEAEPFYPFVAAEEPEAHLHPNAQRTLYKQLIETEGQVLISTHSPYLAAMAELAQIRSLTKTGSGTEVSSLVEGLDPEDINILHREVMRFRGEILFSKALILFEGVTEEQLIPAMFEHYFDSPTFTKGVNCISVGGKNYPPFIKLACSLGVPVYIVSDNDGSTKDEIEAQVNKIKRDTSLVLSTDEFGLSFLNDGNDIEAELLNSLGLRDESIEALVLSETRGSDNEHYVAAKRTEISGLTNEELLEALRNSKASYAGFFADVICRNPHGRSREELVPNAIVEAFEKIEEWLTL